MRSMYWILYCNDSHRSEIHCNFKYVETYSRFWLRWERLCGILPHRVTILDLTLFERMFSFSYKSEYRHIEVDWFEIVGERAFVTGTCRLRLFFRASSIKIVLENECINMYSASYLVRTVISDKNVTNHSGESFNRFHVSHSSCEVKRSATYALLVREIYRP